MTETPPDDQHKVSHWDRPKPPHDWRWVVGGIGRALITLGLLMFGFVAYQLWGTGIQTAQAQRKLSAQFEKLVNQLDPTTTTSTPPPTTEVTPISSGPPVTDTVPTVEPTTTTVPGLPAAQPVPADGDAVARLEIPRMGLNRFVVEGATSGDLAKGPGHFSETPLPGQLGNAAIAGHRTTHLHPFYDIDQLQPGDEITVTTFNGHYVYSVTGTEVVSPDDYAAVIPTTDPTIATLTLVSCTPRYSSTNRIVVHSQLVVEKSDPLTQPAAAPPTEPSNSEPTLPDESGSTTAATVTAATVTATGASTVPGSVSTSTAPSAATTPADGVEPDGPVPTATSPDAFADGWFSDTSAIPQTLMWAALLAAIAYGIIWLSRKVRRYTVGIVAGFVPFVVVLYFFYENVNRLLPPNL